MTREFDELQIIAGKDHSDVQRTLNQWRRQFLLNVVSLTTDPTSGELIVLVERTPKQK